MNSEWSEFTLGKECAKIGSGATPRGGSDVYLPAGRVSLIRSQNVYNDRFSRDGLVYLKEEHAAELENVEVQEGDVLLNITGDSVARCCQVDPRVLPARVNQHVAIIRPRAERLDARYLRYFLVSPPMQAKMLSWAGSGGTRNALTKGMIESFHVPAPRDIRVQRAIAHVLGTLDDKIDLNRQMNETLEGIARAIFRSWFMDFDPVRAKAEGRDPTLPEHIADLFPDKFEDHPDGPVPKGWDMAPLPQIIEVNPPRSLRRGEIAPYLDMANMPTRGHMPDQWIDRPFGSGMRFVNGDTLFARITPCLENGKTAWVTFLPEGQTGWGSTEFIVLRPKAAIPAVFAYCLARSEEFRQFAIQKMTGSSGRQRVPSESLSRFMLVKPPEEVFTAFGRMVEPLFARATANAMSSRTLAGIRDALLPKLLSGELRVPDTERLLRRAT